MNQVAQYTNPLLESGKYYQQKDLKVQIADLTVHMGLFCKARDKMAGIHNQWCRTPYVDYLCNTERKIYTQRAIHCKDKLTPRYVKLERVMTTS